METGVAAAVPRMRDARFGAGMADGAVGSAGRPRLHFRVLDGERLDLLLRSDDPLIIREQQPAQRRRIVQIDDGSRGGGLGPALH